MSPASRRIEVDLAGLRIDPADVLVGEIGKYTLFFESAITS